MDIFVGNFNEQELIDKKDKAAVEKAQKETGLKYIKTKICKNKRERVIKIWLSNNF